MTPKLPELKAAGGAPANRRSATKESGPRLDLATFLPYRLSVLQLAVSRSLAQIYGARFNLSRHEWRALAVLAQDAPLSAVEVAERTSMDKVQVSRAVARLTADGRVARRTDPQDRRRALLRLTAKGRDTYRQIVPLVSAREDELLAVLAKSEKIALDRILEKLYRRALELQRDI